MTTVVGDATPARLCPSTYPPSASESYSDEAGWSGPLHCTLSNGHKSYLHWNSSISWTGGMKEDVCLYRWNDMIIHTCEGHGRGVLEHRCPCGAVSIPPRSGVPKISEVAA